MTVVKFRWFRLRKREVLALVVGTALGVGGMLAYYAGAFDHLPAAWKAVSSFVEAVLPEPFADKDCRDFPDQQSAQKFFESEGPGDPHNLDEDTDGVACNWNAPYGERQGRD